MFKKFFDLTPRTPAQAAFVAKREVKPIKAKYNADAQYGTKNARTALAVYGD